MRLCLELMSLKFPRFYSVGQKCVSYVYIYNGNEMTGFQMPVFSNIVFCLILENEVDGDAFLALTEDMIKSLIPTIGPRSKFLAKHKKLLDTLVNCCIYACM